MLAEGKSHELLAIPEYPPLRHDYFPDRYGVGLYAMTEIVYIIIHTPDDKHRLIQRMIDGEGQPIEVDRGLYASPELAIAAMRRIIKPETTYFDKDGEKIR